MGIKRYVKESEIFILENQRQFFTKKLKAKYKLHLMPRKHILMRTLAKMSKAL